MQRNLERIFGTDGKTVILPLDHGTAIPVPGLEDPRRVIETMKEHVDGFVVNLGVALHCQEALADTGLCLRTDVYKPDTTEGSFKLFGGEDAEVVNAAAMMHMLYPGHENEAEITRECSETILEGLEVNIPTIVEALPDGLGLPESYTTDKLSFAARQAAELGAAVVKTAFPTGGSAQDFQHVVDASFVPVIVLGGAAMGDDRALLSMVSEAMQGGASGIAVGRNVWQHADPPRIAAQLSAIVHQGASVEDALALG